MELTREEMFQSLIGRLRTREGKAIDGIANVLFQSLIGRLRTHEQENMLALR